MTEPAKADSPTLQPRLALCTALPEELAACRLILDDPPPVNPHSREDNNQYRCGTLATGNISVGRWIRPDKPPIFFGSVALFSDQRSRPSSRRN